MISNYETLFKEFLLTVIAEGKTVGIGVLSHSGNLLYTNKALSFFLKKDEPKPNRFVNPTIENILTMDGDGEVFNGILTIGNLNDEHFALQTSIYRNKENIIIIAEANVPHLFKENSKMSMLNQEVNNLQRQLIIEKKNLQRTLTELKETQDQLIHSEKMNALGNLVAGVAHEINNPLAFVNSNLHSLKRDTKEILDTFQELTKLAAKSEDPQLSEKSQLILKDKDLEFMIDDVYDMLEESNVGVERVKTIVEDLRKFSRLDEADSKNINLVEDIQSTLTILKSDIASKNITLEVQSPETLFVNCYPRQLNQALFNILLNAIQAVNSNGRIKLKISSSNNTLLINIEDNGKGIDEEIAKRIFDPFFTTKAVGEGTGLGLSIAYKIIHNLHQGTISFNSVIGKGTRFQISIPLH